MKNNLIRASVFEFLKVCIFYKLSALFVLFTIEQSFILFFILVTLDFVLCLTKISNFRKNIIKLDSPCLDSHISESGIDKIPDSCFKYIFDNTKKDTSILDFAYKVYGDLNVQ